MSTSSRILRVGLVQQSCSADVEANKQKLARNIADVAQQGAQLVILQELHNSLYFCQTENTELFDLAEPIPGLQPTFTVNWHASTTSCWLLRYSNVAQPVCITTRQ